MPQGFEKKGKVVKLEKELYGLKQAAGLWHESVKVELDKIGLRPTESDVCLFTNSERDIFVLLHVDDFQILGPNIHQIRKLAKALRSKLNLRLFLATNSSVSM